ncbi:MAG: sugar ABC transporter ATP-binding protein [Synergistaceae bacterium]|jgi:ABC-type sugar transport system ATPase subunit|nr:sugar ABC transporter ATP-binding protein [Synergistaceae bacterium]
MKAKGPDTMEPYLRVKNIGKTFPGVIALNDVSADFYAGEVHALVGENGAGKSTLIKIISGVYTPTEGEVLLGGQAAGIETPRQALDKGIAVIHQELSIANDLTVAENIFLGEEPRIKGGMFLDRKKMNADAQKVLDFMKVSIRAGDVARRLTAAQQQMVEIAKVITKETKIVIMDEPTSSLSEHEISSLFEQVAILKKRGVAVIYITHRLKELFMICDKVTVMRDGCVVNTFKIDGVTEREIVSNMVGREMKDYYVRTVHTKGREMLRVENLSMEGVFKNISFAAHSGEILGIYGLIGAGRTEVMESIFGARGVTSGKIFVEGKEARFSSPRDAIASSIGLVTEDRRRTGLMLDALVKDNMVLPSLVQHQKRGGFLDIKWETETAAEYVEKMKVKTPSINTVIRTLSGGNQQKVILAKWMIANSNILILDEPTRGIDVNAKAEFYTLMNAFVENGGCIMAVSSELPEIMGISDRILVMREGLISGELSHDEASEQGIIELASLHSGI